MRYKRLRFEYKFYHKMVFLFILPIDISKPFSNIFNGYFMIYAKGYGPIWLHGRVLVEAKQLFFAISYELAYST